MTDSKIFRLFVSSTFSDMAGERGALHQNVYPRLRALCASFGARFQAIDLRWGVSDEAGNNQQTLNICLAEVKRCQEVTRRPNFLVLLGDRYGWLPLPYEIAKPEFDDLLLQLSEPLSLALLQQWYRLDENGIPSVMVLQPRTDEFVDPQTWMPIEHRLQTILESASQHLALEHRSKYATSATEQEIEQWVFAAENPTESVYCFFRTIRNLPRDRTAKGYRDLLDDGIWDQPAYEKLNALKARLRTTLPANCVDFEAEWANGSISPNYLDAFCEVVYKRLSQTIEEDLKAPTQKPDLWEKEIAAHDAFAKNRVQHFVGRAETLAQLDSYLAQYSNRPCVVHGLSGIGKTTLMARMTDRAQAAHPEAEQVCRFIGVTANSSDIRSLLEGICRQIAQRFGSGIAIPSDYRELVITLDVLLHQASAEHPLCIMLDALDQLSGQYDAPELKWLPLELPDHVFLICSTLPGHQFDILREDMPTADFVELKSMSVDEGQDLLRFWLTEVRRTLQPDQEAAVLRPFETNGLPLYLKLAFEEARLWASYASPVNLSPTIPGIIRDNLFRRLEDEANHGKMLCAHALAYFTAARRGLTEEELLDLLVLDDDYWEYLQKVSTAHRHVLLDRHIPIVIWSRLYYDLSPYLTDRAVDGTIVLDFYHGQLWQAAEKRYLQESQGALYHRQMARYFEDSPLYFAHNEQKTPNRRKLTELPFHFYNAKLLPQLIALLTDTREWMDAQFAATQGDSAFIDDLESTLPAFNDPLDAEGLLGIFRLFSAWQVVYSRRMSTIPITCNPSSGWGGKPKPFMRRACGRGWLPKFVTRA